MRRIGTLFLLGGMAIFLMTGFPGSVPAQEEPTLEPAAARTLTRATVEREKQLAGVRLGDFALDLLDVLLYQTPTRVCKPGATGVGGTVAVGQPAGQTGGGGGGAGGPGTGGMGGPGMGGMGGPGMGGMGGPGTGGPEGGKGGPGMGGPGQGGMMGPGAGGMGGGGQGGMMGPGAGGMGGGPGGGGGGMGGGQSSGGQGGALSLEGAEAGDIVWVYELNYDRHYHVVPSQIVEVTLDIDGIVKSVAVFGRKWGGARTSKGIKLGDPWRFVMRSHGPPDEVEAKGKETIVYYRERNNLAFAFHENEKAANQREVTSIVITMPQ